MKVTVFLLLFSLMVSNRAIAQMHTYINPACQTDAMSDRTIYGFYDSSTEALHAAWELSEDPNYENAGGYYRDTYKWLYYIVRNKQTNELIFFYAPGYGYTCCYDEVNPDDARNNFSAPGCETSNMLIRDVYGVYSSGQEALNASWEYQEKLCAKVTGGGYNWDTSNWIYYYVTNTDTGETVYFYAPTNSSCYDECPDDPNKRFPGLCGCGVVDSNEDSDNDGTPDCNDGCPNNPYKTEPGTFGCQESIQNGFDSGQSCMERKLELQANPISIYSGNNIEFIEDFHFNSPFEDGLSFKRYYNSRYLNNVHLGIGWTHSYSVLLQPEYNISENIIGILDETGRGVYFQDSNSDGIYDGLYNETTQVGITTESGDSIYVWSRDNGLTYAFNLEGKLIWIQDKDNNRQNLAYNQPTQNLETVTDVASGRILTFQYNSDNLIETITGPITPTVSNGVWVTFGYDPNNNLVNVTYAEGSGNLYKYEDTNDPHNMTQKEDASGNILSAWLYDAQDRAYQNTNSIGKSATIDYDTYAADSKIGVTDAYNVERKYALSQPTDVKYRITAVEGGSGCASCGEDVADIQYNTDLRITQIEYVNGRIDRYENLDSMGNAQTLRKAYGTNDERVIYRTFETTNHPEMRLMLSQQEISLLDSGSGTLFKETIWDYDDDYDGTPNEDPTPLLRKIIEKGYTLDSSGAVVPYEYVTTLTYYSNGQVQSIDGPIDGSDDTTEFTYDASGNLLTVTQPLIGTTTYSGYDAAGNPEAVTDVNGVTTSFNTYDGRNRLLSWTRNGITNTRSYNQSGNIGSVTDGTGVSLTFDYYGQAAGISKNGHLWKVTDPLGNYLAYDYDTRSNVTDSSSYNASDERQQQSRYNYNGPDIPGKLWKAILRNHDNTADLETIFGYDNMGNQDSVTDAMSNQTTTTYDLLNHPTTITQPGGIITSYGYDLHGNLSQVTDGKNNSTVYSYDDLGRVVKSVSPESGTVRYVYDSAGRLETIIKNSVETIGYDYDELNRLTNIDYQDSSQNVTFTYDAYQAGVNYGKGLLTGVENPGSTYTYQYDANGNLTEEVKVINGISYTTGYTYDDADRIASITYPDGRIVTYHPNVAGQIASVTYKKDSQSASQNLATGIAYEPFGPIKDLSFGNGITLSRTYDLNYQLDTVTAGSVQELDYAYDDIGNVSEIINSLDITRDQGFDYDALFRLTEATGILGTINYVNDNNGYVGYDNVGNRLFRTIDDQLDTAYTYQSGSNKLLQTDATTQTVYYSYDSDGNTLSTTTGQAGTTTGSTVDYAYNHNGQRIKKVVNNGTSTVTTIYHYDLSGNIIAETDGAGNPKCAYIYLNGELLAKVDGNSTSESIYYYHNDHLGTPQKLTNTNGIVVWAADYDPFGTATVSAGSTIENNMRFPGQYYDAETGLHYNYYRYYDPSIGRYLTPDPIGLAGGINLYAYVGGNPVNYSDPFGLWPFGMPGEDTAKKYGPGWVDYYLPGLDQKKKQKIVNEVIDELGWSDVVDATAKFGKDFRPPSPDKLKDLKPEQKKFITEFIDELKIDKETKERINKLLNPPKENKTKCEKK
ncbi:MAG: RHS repeat-associated core domain-containing protein [Pseudomonadota bacterium]